MKKKNLFSGQNKYDLFRKLDKDQTGRISGGKKSQNGDKVTDRNKAVNLIIDIS